MEEIFGISQSLPIILKLHRNGDILFINSKLKFQYLIFPQINFSISHYVRIFGLSLLRIFP